MAAVCKRAKHALSDITSQNTPQEQSGGGGKKTIKRKAHLKNTSSPPGKRRKTTPQKQQQENLNFYRKLSTSRLYRVYEIGTRFFHCSHHTDLYYQGTVDRVSPFE